MEISQGMMRSQEERQIHLKLLYDLYLCPCFLLGKYFGSSKKVNLQDFTGKKSSWSSEDINT